VPAPERPVPVAPATRDYDYENYITANPTTTKTLEQFRAERAAARAARPRPELAPPSTGGQIQQATTGVANAQADSAASSGGGATNIVAPSNSTVVNNNQSAPVAKDTRNTESTFQRYLDRRYYPTAMR
jgi:hypothetical protein